MDQYIWRKEDINVLEVIISQALCVGGGTHDEQYWHHPTKQSSNDRWCKYVDRYIKIRNILEKIEVVMNARNLQKQP